MTAEITLTIRNDDGLDLAAAARFVRIANRFPCEIRVREASQVVNGKSVMGLLMLVAGRGTTLTIAANGEGDDIAVATLAALIERGFTE